MKELTRLLNGKKTR